MTLPLNQQILELVKKSRNILIAFKKDWTGDAVSGALALAEFLKRAGKDADIACHGFKPKSNLSFLPASLIQSQLKDLQKFIISLDTAKTPLGEFYYDQGDGKLNIYLMPKEGRFSHQDVSTATSDYKYDLIFTLNSPDLDSLEKIFEDHRDFFFSTPKINIDHSPANENYGDINLVNLTAASTSEIIFSLLKNWQKELINDDIATYLLTGIISATKNFKISNLNPLTLASAGELVALGGRREQIVQNLYQTKFVSTLKLWGRILARLNNDLDDKLVWSSLSRQDFLETATDPGEILDVVDELIVSMPKIQAIVLLYENQEKEIDCLVYAVKNLDALEISKKFEPTGNPELARFNLKNISLAEAERTVIEEVKRKI
ncbi:MAG: DHH family phosphoesterase [Patescibacteria group bacterium]